MSFFLKFVYWEQYFKPICTRITIQIQIGLVILIWVILFSEKKNIFKAKAYSILLAIRTICLTILSRVTTKKVFHCTIGNLGNLKHYGYLKDINIILK
jgi:hypothetical protein